jgi:hypothetical protein
MTLKPIDPETLTGDDKIITPLEAIDDMIEQGERTIHDMKNELVRAEVMDRLGKRLLLQGDKYANKVGEAQKRLSVMKSQLTQLEMAQKDMKTLREDMLAEENKPATLE